MKKHDWWYLWMDCSKFGCGLECRICIKFSSSYIHVWCNNYQLIFLWLANGNAVDVSTWWSCSNTYPLAMSTEYYSMLLSSFFNVSPFHIPIFCFVFHSIFLVLTSIILLILSYLMCLAPDADGAVCVSLEVIYEKGYMIIRIIYYFWVFFAYFVHDNDDVDFKMWKDVRGLVQYLHCLW